MLKVPDCYLEVCGVEGRGPDSYRDEPHQPPPSRELSGFKAVLKRAAFVIYRPQEQNFLNQFSIHYLQNLCMIQLIKICPQFVDISYIYLYVN